MDSPNAQNIKGRSAVIVSEIYHLELKCNNQYTQSWLQLGTATASKTHLNNHWLKNERRSAAYPTQIPVYIKV